MPTRRVTSQQPSLSRGAHSVNRVWMLSYECAGLAQAGGLGEAVAGLARTLAQDSKIEVTVFLPSHGRHLDQDLRTVYNLKDETTFIANGYRTGTDHLHYRYLAGIERGHRDSVRYALVKGLDGRTSKWLNHRTLYDSNVVFEKMSLFARTVKTYSDYLLATGSLSNLPDLIHVHDWHMIPAGVALKQSLEENRVRVPLVFTIHLLGRVSLRWHYGSEAWCGIRDLQHDVKIGRKGVFTLGYRQVWEEYCHDSLERFGCYEANYVTSVSSSYLTHDVSDYVGNAIKGKSGHVYNGCDWDNEEINSMVRVDQTGEKPIGLNDQYLNRWDLRRQLLTQGLAEARPTVEGQNNLDGSQERRDQSKRLIEPFEEDGSLVLMTGRLSPQKGVDILLDAVPRILKVLPSTKFLFFLLPSNDPDSNKSTSMVAAGYPRNVRLIMGRDRPLYLFSHVAADVYAMPSRVEPFGISALEAMITGNPVVGADVGGLRETVLDIQKYGDTGTGILTPAEDARSLSSALISMIITMKIDESSQRGEVDMSDSVEEIPSKPIREMVGKNPRFGSMIRENGRSRVEEKFRWKNAGLLALARYAKAKQLSTKPTVYSKGGKSSRN
ncbi:glycosyltransferase [Candidatus Bathyarchaeota archaeon]|nr:MAG: glycosyltransferase [Candidatus Bathyarchaeota archaeon]